MLLLLCQRHYVVAKSIYSCLFFGNLNRRVGKGGYQRPVTFLMWDALSYVLSSEVGGKVESPLGIVVGQVCCNPQRMDLCQKR